MTKKSETCVELTAPYQLVFSGMACVQPLTSVTTTFSFHNSHQKGASHLNTNLVVYNVNGSLYTLTQFHNGYQWFSNLCEWFHALRYSPLIMYFEQGFFSITFLNFKKVSFQPLSSISSSCLLHFIYSDDQVSHCCRIERPLQLALTLMIHVIIPANWSASQHWLITGGYPCILISHTIATYNLYNFSSN